MIAPYLHGRVLPTSIHAVKKKETPDGKDAHTGVNPDGRGRRRQLREQ
jgi:hypothetical protein